MVMRAYKTFCVIAYDIADNKTRNKITKILKQYGTPINLSVFECMTTEYQYNNLVKELNNIINVKTDRIVYYRICLNCYSKITYYPKDIKPIAKISNIV